MRTSILALIAFLLLLTRSVAAVDHQPLLNLLPESAQPEARLAQDEALAVMEEFMRTFNAADVPALANTLAFPHVRFASGGVRVFQDQDGFIDATDMQAFAKRFNWSRSQWDSITTVQADADKVHFAVRFTRLDAQGEPTKSFNSLYILQRSDAGWGIRARSSFAP